MRPILFDLEGTLVTFQWDLETAERRARTVLADLGLPGVADESKSYAELYNDGLAAAEATGVDPATVERRLDEVYDEFDERALDSWSLRPGAGEVVGALDRTGLVTNVGRDATVALLDRSGLTFDPVITRADVGRIKPDPGGLVRASKALDGDPLFVGDSVTDVLAGTRAGLEVAVVDGGESAPADLVGHEPAHRLDSLRDLEDLL